MGGGSKDTKPPPPPAASTPPTSIGASSVQAAATKQRQSRYGLPGTIMTGDASRGGAPGLSTQPLVTNAELGGKKLTGE